jgi:hypothetical protein
MNTELFKQVKEFVNSSFNHKGINHFEQTVYWVKKLKPDADEALLIAAYAHDIQRAFRGSQIEKAIKKSKKGFNDKKLMKLHQEKGAEIMGKFLEKEGADKNLIERVKHLISRHEWGGDDNQNLLKDADSLSFFECNIEHFIKIKAREMGKDKVKAKFDWMYERITSPKAKKIAKPIYQKAIKDLEKS